MLKGYVEIERMRVTANHGVMPQERRVGNVFEVSVGLWYDMEQAATYDYVEAAISYATIAEVIKRVMADDSNLLEAVAYKLMMTLRSEFSQILGGRVEIRKLTPPIKAQMAAASVSLEW